MDPRGLGGGVCLSFSVNNTRLLINTSPDRVRRSAELFIKVRLGIRQKEEEKKSACLVGPHKTGLIACFNEPASSGWRLNLSNLGLGIKIFKIPCSVLSNSALNMK